jgi:hypothetical protein
MKQLVITIMPDGRLILPQCDNPIAVRIDGSVDEKFVFECVRSFVINTGGSAFAIASPVWVGKLTAKGQELCESTPGDYYREIRQRVLREGPGRGDEFEQAIQEGLMERAEAICITALTPKRVRIVTQFFMRQDPGRITFTERRTEEFSQSDYQNRLLFPE